MFVLRYSISDREVIVTPIQNTRTAGIDKHKNLLTHYKVTARLATLLKFMYASM